MVGSSKLAMKSQWAHSPIDVITLTQSNDEKHSEHTHLSNGTHEGPQYLVLNHNRAHPSNDVITIAYPNDIKWAPSIQKMDNNGGGQPYND